uniref:Uncharacterized protein n=1 Tax=Suricata suricatta TaxID=37032 RepID=A0A673TS62_SURSU
MTFGLGVITCRAAVAWKTGSTLAIEEVQVEPPKAQEVRIKVISTGICGTDDHALKGLLSANFPLIPGHEGAGIVESIGKGVSSMKPGDKVLILIIPQCRECSACLHPEGNFCENVLPSSGLMLDGTSRFTCKGKKIYHSFRASTFTEYTVVPEIAVAKIDAAAPMDKVSIISCEVPTGYGAAVNSAKVTRGSTCVVFGLGGIGSAIVMGCKASGASRIIGIDINEEKFPRARNLKKPVQEVVMEMTGAGADFAFEAIGLTDTMVCGLGYGVCLIVGLAPSKENLHYIFTLVFFWVIWHFSNLIIIAFFCFADYKTRDCTPQLVIDYLQNKINIDPLITHQLPFDQLHKAFELYHAGKTTVLSARNTVENKQQ